MSIREWITVRITYDPSHHIHRTFRALWSTVRMPSESRSDLRITLHCFESGRENSNLTTAHEPERSQTVGRALHNVRHTHSDSARWEASGAPEAMLQSVCSLLGCMAQFAIHAIRHRAKAFEWSSWSLRGRRRIPAFCHKTATHALLVR